MKKLRFILATFVAVFLAFTGSKALADTYTITINGDTTGHTYEAYQIFKGDLSGDTLSNIQWGNGVTPFNYNSKSTASDIAATLKTDADAKSFAAEAGKHLSTTTSGNYANGKITGLEAGYYLVKDKDNTVPKDGAYTSFIMEVVKNVSVNTKSSVPKVEKKVKDINDSTDSEMSDWQDSADHDINDKVPFKLTATLPSNFDSYKEYYLEFKDTLSAGLTYNKDAKVYLVNNGVKTDVTSSFTIADNGSSYKINNLKSLSGVTATTKVVVEYTATLNEHAVIGSAGNPNTVHLEYSNNPNYTGNGENSPKGETPKDTVIVFTYKTVVNKVDQNKQPLAGAEFKLFKVLKDGSEKEVTTVEKNSTGDKFTFKGLDDGKYILKETKTPAGYNTIADVEFKISAEMDLTSDNPTLKSLTATATSTNKLTFTSNITDGSLTADVVNKKGSILPSTGSIGTTILYAVGTILVLGAGALLIVRKRMNTK